MVAMISVGAAGSMQAQALAERARDMGIVLDGTTGPLDAITDVPGVAVGHATVIRGMGRLRVGAGPVRTGVTAIFPRGTGNLDEVFAGWFSLNGNGEMTGTPWIDDYGLLLYPITITNTNSVGTVRDAVIDWGRTRVPGVFNCCLPAVAETWDGDLNDIYGFHVRKEHVFSALADAKPGAVAEGNVGGGTGMQCLGYKGGIGTASRRLETHAGGFTVGALVQCNFGLRRQLRIAGVPVAREIQVPEPCYATHGPLPDDAAPLPGLATGSTARSL
jgi:D-aminopeptidase